jgi:hypothetical protein
MTTGSQGMDLVTAQLAEVQRRHANASFESTPEGHRILIVPSVRLYPGWSRDEVSIRIVVPAGYPHVKPDCFYTEADLRLASGQEPTNSTQQPVLGGQYRWFSWHLAGWNPTQDTLDRYVRFCEARLKDAT